MKKIKLIFLQKSNKNKDKDGGINRIMKRVWKWGSVKILGQDEMIFVSQDPLINYQIDSVSIIVYPNLYIVKEPELSDEAKVSIAKIIEYIYYSAQPEPFTKNTHDDIKKYIEELIWSAIKSLKIDNDESLDFFPAFMYYVQRDVFGYGPLNVLLKDEYIEELSMVGPNKPVYVVHRIVSNYKKWIPTNIILDENEAFLVVQKIVQRGKGYLSFAMPISDVLLPEGHRAAVTYSNEVTPWGHSFTIRKFPSKRLSIIDLIKQNSITPLTAAYLSLILETRGCIFILGPTASGKTTMLNALLELVPLDWKIVTVEDTPEILVPHSQWDRLVSRKTLPGEEVNEIDLFELTKFAWRRRPDLLIVGEVRGREAQALVHAVASGHGGLTTFHADSARSAILRLRSPPLSIEPSFTLLISAFINMREINPGYRILYSIEELYEESDISIVPRAIYEHGINLAAEKLVEVSNAMKRVANIKGWNKEHIVSELERRKSILQDLSVKSFSNKNELLEEISIKLYGEHNE
ncbi:MAG: type II/IV secretion system ATPase subunit [Thermoprotei archaeon]